MDKKISQLTAAATLTGTELLPIVQGGITVQTTAQDIADLAGGGLPYLVYTALLTQSGDDTIPAAINSSPLTIGVTYEIVDNTGINVTNVGSPNNNVGTKFVATGTTPSSWGSGSLSYIPSAPVVTVLENTIGNVWWTYNSLGTYFIESNGLFIQNKTALNFGGVYYNANVDTTVGYGPNGNINEYPYKLGIQCMRTQGDQKEDNILFNTFIEIRVYP